MKKYYVVGKESGDVKDFKTLNEQIMNKRNFVQKKEL